MARFEIPELVKRDVVMHLISRLNEKCNVETVLNILKPKLKPNLTWQEEKELIGCISTWRCHVRKKFAQLRGCGPKKFLEKEASWLSTPVTLPMKFKYVKLDPSEDEIDDGIKLRQPSSYCIMCSGTIAENWPLLITKRLAKSICTAMKLKPTQDVQFDTSLKGCCMCSTCYDKVIEVNDLVKELEQIEIKILRLTEEFDKILAEGMEKHKSLAVEVHGVEESYLTPIEIRREIMESRAKDRLASVSTTQKQNFEKVPFSTTTRRSGFGGSSSSKASTKGAKIVPAISNFTGRCSGGILSRTADEFGQACHDSGINRSEGKPRAANSNQKIIKLMNRNTETNNLAALVTFVIPSSVYSTNNSLVSDESYVELSRKVTQKQTNSHLIAPASSSVTPAAFEVNSTKKEGDYLTNEEFKYVPLEDSDPPTYLSGDELPPVADTMWKDGNITTLFSQNGAEYSTGNAELRLAHGIESDDISLGGSSELESIENETARNKNPFSESESFRQLHYRLEQRLKRKRDSNIAKSKGQPKSKTTLKRKPKRITARSKTIHCKVPGCQYRCARVDQLAGHVYLIHHNDPLPYKCTFPGCQKETTTYTNLVSHRQLNHGIALPVHGCDLCKKRFQTIKGLEYHKDFVHNSHGNSIICEICGKPCLSKRNHKNHTKTHETSWLQSLTCPVTNCERRFNTKYELRSHQGRSHADEFPDLRPLATKSATICDECGKIYVSEMALRDHRLKHHTPGHVTIKKPYIRKCHVPNCGFETKKALEMKVHRQYHSGQTVAQAPPKFKCTFPNCLQEFSQEISLSSHVLRHDPNLVTLMCTYCGKDGFITKRFVEKHEKICLGKQTMEHICEKCNSAFAAKRYLLRHRAYTPNCKPHEPGPGAVYCPQCNKCCSSNNSLSRHLQLIHNPHDKPFRCNGCEKSYAIKMYLTRHLRLSKICPASSGYSASTSDF